MASDGKFKVRCLATGQWVAGLIVQPGHSDTISLSHGPPCAFDGPAARAYFGAQADKYEIVPEPPPFVFPPTPLAFDDAIIRDASGRALFHANADSGAIWREVLRRVNWHDTARDALARINNGEDDGEPDRVAFRALAKLPEGPTP